MVEQNNERGRLRQGKKRRGVYRGKSREKKRRRD